MSWRRWFRCRSVCAMTVAVALAAAAVAIAAARVVSFQSMLQTVVQSTLLANDGNGGSVLAAFGVA